MPVIAAIVIGGTGLGLQLKGAHEAGKAAQAQAKSEAAWQEYNAKIADREAIEAQETAAFEERKARKAGERLKATRRTKLGQAGVSGISTDLVTEETITELELDALLIRRGGTSQARSLTASGQLSRLKGRSALLRGKSARRAGRFFSPGQLGTLASGGSSLYFAASR